MNFGVVNRLRRSAADAAVEVRLEAGEVDIIGGRPEGCIDVYCGKPLRGGVRIFGGPENPSDRCTAGFQTIDNNGGKYLLTAGR